MLVKMQKYGDWMIEAFHFLALFVIGATVIWSAGHEYIKILNQGYAGLKEILLLFIYLELGAMVGIYFKTHRLPVQYLIYIAITALSRHLVIDVQKVSTDFQLYLLLVTTACIVALSLGVMALSFTASRYGRPEDQVRDQHNSKNITPEDGPEKI